MTFTDARINLSRHLVVKFVALAYLVSWVIWSLLFLPGIGASGWATWLIPAGGFGPAIAAFVTVWRSEGRTALKTWLRSLLVWRLHLGWYALALVLPFGFRLRRVWSLRAAGGHSSGGLAGCTVDGLPALARVCLFVWRRTGGDGLARLFIAAFAAPL